MMKRYMHGELAPDVAKKPNEPMAIDPNSKVKQGDMSGDETIFNKLKHLKYMMKKDG